MFGRSAFGLYFMNLQGDLKVVGVALPLVLMLLELLFSTFFTASMDVVNVGLDKDKLKSFLEEQVVPEVGLLRAAVEAYPDNVTIWVASDNLLAVEALKILNSRYAYVVKEKLEEYFNGGFNGLHEVLLGVDIPNEVRDSTILELGSVYSKKFGTTFIIKYEIHNGTSINDWREYADLLVYKALDALIEGDVSVAEELLRRLTSMWDGYGFYDKVVKAREEVEGVKYYSTYKCALFIYLYNALKHVNPKVIHEYNGIYSKCVNVISKAQHPVYGGIATEYIASSEEDVEMLGDVNTETTSIAILALLSDYPEVVGVKALRKQQVNAYIMLLAVTSITTLFTLTVAFQILRGRVK